jgi:hypothetical protein
MSVAMKKDVTHSSDAGSKCPAFKAMKPKSLIGG